MSDCLFVYGTLMRRATASRLGREQRARLDEAGEWLGQATIAGRLFDRGRYPLLVAASSRTDLVHGEVYRLRSAPLVFRWLDPYEGIPEGTTRGDEYARRIEPVTLGDGKLVEAWVYVHLGDPQAAGLKRISDGRWMPPPLIRPRGRS